MPESRENPLEVYRIFNSPRGRAVIERLKNKFSRKYVEGDPLATHINSAKAEVVDFIEDVAQQAKKG